MFWQEYAKQKTPQARRVFENEALKGITKKLAFDSEYRFPFRILGHHAKRYQFPSPNKHNRDLDEQTPAYVTLRQQRRRMAQAVHLVTTMKTLAPKGVRLAKVTFRLDRRRKKVRATADSDGPEVSESWEEEEVLVPWDLEAGRTVAEAESRRKIERQSRRAAKRGRRRADKGYSLYTLHSTLYTLHSTLYTLPSTLYNLHSTIYPLQSILYTRHSTL
jgi:hypothetical protein